MTDGYRVEIKPSARRRNAAVGRTVNGEGPRHEFPDRDAAEAWAERLSSEGPLVWIRAANPGDDGVDGYLMGRRPRRDRRQTPPGRQVEVDGVEPTS